MKNGAKASSVQPLSALRSFRSLNARKAWVKPMRIATNPRIRTMTRPQDRGANRQLGSGPARARRSVPVLFGVLLVLDGFEQKVTPWGYFVAAADLSKDASKVGTWAEFLMTPELVSNFPTIQEEFMAGKKTKQEVIDYVDAQWYKYSKQ